MNNFMFFEIQLEPEKRILALAAVETSDDAEEIRERVLTKRPAALTYILDVSAVPNIHDEEKLQKNRYSVLPNGTVAYTGLAAPSLETQRATVRSRREGRYPLIKDQLDAIWKAIDAISSSGVTLPADALDMLASVKQIKQDLPLP